MVRTDRQAMQLLELLPKLPVQEFLGVCRILKVQIITEDLKPVPMDQLVENVLVNFVAANRQRRRELLKIVKAATR